MGGGGTVWDALAYDPELDLLYVGTGNGSPWSRYVRSPGGGDNLFVSSILALRPDTGELVWHYQTTPGDNWDFTSTQHMILADLELGGRTRKVLMQAPKNGFFYVLDRETGELLSAEPFVTVTWAKGVDSRPGGRSRPPGLDYREQTVEVKPAPFGAHNWQPMSFNPKTGLVYIPAQEIPYFFRLDKEWKHRMGAWNTGADPTVADSLPARAGVGPPAGLGSGRAEGGLARAVHAAVERRHAHHRGQPRLPGHRARHLRGLPRDRRQAPVRGAGRHRHRRAARHVPSSTASSTWP